jgi:hypothetical protein
LRLFDSSIHDDRAQPSDRVGNFVSERFVQTEGMGNEDGSPRAGARGGVWSSRALALVGLVVALCASTACGDGVAQGPADAATSDGLSTDAPSSGEDAADSGALVDNADAAGGSNDATTDASTACRAASDCADGGVCVGFFCAGTSSCMPQPRKCEPDPCGGVLMCACASSLCAGYASCDVDPDAGAVFCSTIASMDDAGPL